MRGVGSATGLEVTELVLFVDLAELGFEGFSFGGVGAGGAIVAVGAGFEGGVGFVAGLVVLLEVEELAEEGLGAGQEAAVVVPEAGQGRGLVFEEVEGGEVVGVVLGVKRGVRRRTLMGRGE